MSIEEPFPHPLYKYCKESEADALAYAFINKSEMIKFPFKFPPLLPLEIRANVLYTGLCQSDIMTVRGKWGEQIYPKAPGHEIICEVSELGSEVKDFKKGEIVAFGTMRDSCGKCKVCKLGHEEICCNVEEKGTYSKIHFGGYATQIQQPANFFFHLPSNFNIEKGAPLLCAGITTYYPMSKYLKEGMKCAVVGIGGLGHVALLFLKKLGYDVTAFTSSENKVSLIKEKLGVNNIIISSNKDMMKNAEKKFDFIINTLPIVDNINDYIKCLNCLGVFIQVGEPSVYNDIMGISAGEIVEKELTIRGSNIGPRNVINDMLKICAEKDIYPIVEMFDFEDFPKAFDKLENGKPCFRCVVNVKDFAEKNGWKR